MSIREGISRFLVLGGRRVGKTYAIVNGFIPGFFTTRCGIAYGAFTDKTNQGGWREIAEYCSGMMNQFGSKGWRFAPAEDGIIRLPNGSTWDRLSFKVADAGRSMTFDGAHIDEVQLITEETIANFLPTLATTRGFAVFSGTVPKTWKEWTESQWWLKIVQADKKEREEKWPDWEIFHEPTDVSDLAWQIREDDKKRGRAEVPWDAYMGLGQKEYNKMRGQMGKDRFRREVEVIIEPPRAGVIWDSIGPTAIGHYPYDPSLPNSEILVGYDRGWGTAMSVVMIVQKYDRLISVDGEEQTESVYRVVKEYADTVGISSRGLIEKAFEMSPDVNFTSFPDPRAKDIHIELDMIGLPSYRGSVSINEGNELVNTRFEQRRIEIDRSCSILIGQSQRYSMTEKNEPQDDDNDTCDALRYVIYNHNIASGQAQMDSMNVAMALMGKGATVGYGYLPL